MKKTSGWIIVLILSCLPLWSLLKPGLPLSHDGPDHVARIANFFQSLSEGNLIPRWAGNLNWGYGHPILMFLYPLPSYLASFFHSVGFSLVDSTKLVFAVSFIFSIFAMFWWVRAQWGTVPAFVSAILYGFAPYRFVDLYVRGAIGEHVAFIFPPIILIGLLQLARFPKKPIKWGMITSLGLAGLLLSHNAVSLMFLPVIFLYLIYLYFFETKKRRRFLIFGFWFIALGFLLSAFFWLPAFWEGKYTLRDIVIQGDFTGRFVPWSRFFYSPWSYGGGQEITKQLGLVHWLGVAGAIWYLLKVKNKPIRWFLGGGLILLVATLILMTQLSAPLWAKVSLIQKFQFPWRFLELTTFLTALLAGAVASLLPKKLLPFIIALALIAALSTFSMWRPEKYLIRPENYYTGIYESTTDTGESSPIWSVRFMEKRPQAVLEVITGKTTWSTVSRQSNLHRYNLKAASRSRLVENTLYFPGWQVWVDQQPVAIEFQDPDYRGLMTFWVESGEHEIVVKFTETKLRYFADIISILAWLSVMGVLGKLLLKKYLC